MLDDLGGAIQRGGAYVAFAVMLLLFIVSLRTGRRLRRLEQMHHDDVPTGRRASERRTRWLNARAARASGSELGSAASAETTSAGG